MQLPPFLPKPKDRPLVIGHRGMFHSEPENSIHAYRGAFEAGVDGIECDVRIGKDGVLFIHHDRESFPSGKRVESLSASAREEIGIVNLDEVVEMMEEFPDKGLVIEVKTLAAGLAVCERYAPTDRRLLLSFSDMAVIHAVEQGWASAYLNGNGRDALRDLTPKGAYYSPLGTIGATLRRKELERSLAWTINDPHLAYQLAQRGVYSITTDHPFGVFRALAA